MGGADDDMVVEVGEVGEVGGGDGKVGVACRLLRGLLPRCRRRREGRGRSLRLGWWRGTRLGSLVVMVSEEAEGHGLRPGGGGSSWVRSGLYGRQPLMWWR